jgi:hypothetical protein
VAKLDSYFDPNERKYFITPESVEVAVKEEQHRVNAANTSKNAGVGGEERPKQTTENETPTDSASRTLRQEIMDLKITNRAKDMFIEQLQKEHEGFALERQGYVEKLMTFNRKLGELETRLNQLESGNGSKLDIAQD